MNRFLRHRFDMVTVDICDTQMVSAPGECHQRDGLARPEPSTGSATLGVNLCFGCRQVSAVRRRRVQQVSVAPGGFERAIVYEQNPIA